MADPTNSDHGVDIQYKAQPRGRGSVLVTLPDGQKIVDRIDIADEMARQKLSRQITDRFPGLAEAELLTQLGDIAAAHEAASGNASHGDHGGRPSQATQLVNLVEATDGVDLFHNADMDAFISVPVGNHRETWRLTAKAARDWLARLYFNDSQRAIGSQALQDALNVLGGRAKHEGAQHDVFLRIGEHDGAIWLDLCNADWDAVRIDASGWTVVPSRDVPIRFMRRKAMQPLPTPVRGGSVNELRSIVNLDDEQFVLAIGWLLAAFRPRGPYAILSVAGEQGSAKSTTCKLLRRLIDPNQADLRRPPKDERDIFISGGNSWVYACNNLSGIQAGMSDALCALATDGGFSVRTLYENDDETIFSTRRPVLLNGIEEPATRSDLLDRTISLTLKRIPETQRLDEDDVNDRFERMRPRVLGALLDAVSAAIRGKHAVRLDRKPRMADVATWVTAGEEALGWEKYRFLNAYMGNRAQSNIDAVDASPIGPIIVSMVQAGPLVGTATELLEEIKKKLPHPEKPPTEWPKNHHALASMLRRLAPNLRSMGMAIEIPEPKGKGHDKRREWRLEWAGGERAASSASPADGPAEHLVPRADYSENDLLRKNVPVVRDGALGCAPAEHADDAVDGNPPCSNQADSCGACGAFVPVADDPPVSDGACRACGQRTWWVAVADDPAKPTCGTCHPPEMPTEQFRWLEVTP